MSVHTPRTPLPAPSPSPLAAHWTLDPDVVFLNHGSFGACPRAIQKVQSRWRARLEAEPVRFMIRELEPLLDESRAELARLIGAPADNLVFVHNATGGVNAVVRSLEFQPGDEILTTNHDYNACRNVLLEAARAAGARVVVAEIPLPVSGPRAVIDAVLAAVTPRTRLAMLDHITSPTALILPVGELIRELEARSVDTLVDGAHAPGMLPLELTALRPAYYTGNLHKWICAPKGAGFLYVREDRHDRVQPPVISHGNNVRRPGRNALHDRFDWPGTLDPTPWICVGEAIRWCGSLLPGGLTALMAANHELAVAARRVLCERLDIEPPGPEAMLGSMAAVQLPRRFQTALPVARVDPLQTRLLDEYRLEVPLMRWGNPSQRWLRVSAQAYNSLEQYRYLAEVLREVPLPSPA